MEIILNKNAGYKWCKNGNVRFKGYFQYDDSLKVYREDEACGEICKVIKNKDDAMSFLSQVGGAFSVIIENEDLVIAAVDISRSMPLYYSNDGLYLSDSAEAIRKSKGIASKQVDMDNYLTLLTNDYLFGNETVYIEIKQLDLGEIIQIDKKSYEITRDYYYRHLINSISNKSINEYKEDLTRNSIEAFIALKEVIRDRPVVLSMSGGYDSRFIGCMLKKVGVKDVSCYTYGKSDSFEVAQSKKNAEALGFRWTYVEHTDDEIRRTLDSVGLQYIDSYDGHDFTAYIQNFPAVRKLHETGWFKPGSVFVTGLCGDMPTGNYLDKEIEGEKYNSEKVANRLYTLIYTRYELPANYKIKALRKLKERVDRLPIDVHDYQTYSQAVECIYTGTNHSHWFLHMNTVHSFFGYEWLLPYWDKRILNEWYSIPAKYKEGQALYEDWLLNDLCKEYGIGQRKYRPIYSTNPLKLKIMYTVGALLSYCHLNTGRPFKRKFDYNNFAPLELLLFKNLNSRSTVNYKKAGLVHLLNQYCLQKRYGVETMKEAIRMIKKR